MERITHSFSEQDRLARNELWKRLVSNFRERLCTLEAQGKIRNPEVIEPLLKEFIATTNGCFLSVWLHPEDGAGSWNQISPIDECEPWSLTPDGTAELSGRRMSISELADTFELKLLPLNR